jgi:hypothetical protein
MALFGLGPGRMRRVWTVLFGPAPQTTHGSAYFGVARDAAACGHLKPAAAQ